MSKLLVWLGVICTGLWLPLCGQKDAAIPFFRIAKETGISHSAIRQVVQDADGYLWIGTEDGLNRFDGRKMVVFNSEPDNPKSLSSNFIEDIAFDAAGNIWVATISGLNKLDPTLGYFERFLPEENEANSLPFPAIQTIKPDDAGRIWIGGKQLACLDTATKRFQVWDIPADGTPVNGALVESIVDISPQELLLATGRGLFRFHKEQGAFTHIPLPIPPSRNPRVIRVFHDSQDRIWASTMNGLFQLDRTYQVLAHYQADPDDPNSVSDHDLSVIMEDPAGYLWFGSFSQGLNRLDPTTGQFQHYRNDAKDEQSLSDNIIWSMLVDQQGSMWVGTNNGLNRTEPGFANSKADGPTQSFASYPSPSSLRPNASVDAIRTILEDQNGDLWVGTDGGGLSLIPQDGGDIISVQHEPDRGSSISSDRVRIIIEDADQNLWLGSFGGLNLLSASTRQAYKGKLTQAPWTHIPIPVPHLPDSVGVQIRALYMGQDGTLWIGSSHNGLYALDPKTQQIKAYVNKPDDPTSLSNNDVLAVYEDRSGNIWVGTFGGGLNKLDKTTGTFTRYQYDPARSTSISDDFVWVFHEDQKGNLWIGTQGGLNCLPAGKDNEFTKLREKDGLPNNVIYGILADQDGRLWLSTNKGLAVYNPKTEQIFSYDKRDGLLADEFNPNAYGDSPRTGKLYFGGVIGYHAFDPAGFQPDTFAPPVVISALIRYRESEQQNEKQINYFAGQKTGLTFTYKDNLITLDVAMLNFRQAHKNIYQYRLQGLQNSWFPLEEGRITFTNLPAGRYTLQIKGANHHGVWQAEPTSIPLRVYPPWWWSFFAKVAYILAALGLLVLFYRYQLNRQLAEREAQELRKLDELKTRFFTNISHEFRTPLTMILGPAKRSLQSLAKNRVAEAINDHRIILQNGQRLLRLINEILDINKLEAGKISPNYVQVDVLELARQITGSFSGLAEESQLNLDLVTTQEELYMDIDPEMLDKILNNLLSNAIRFTSAGGKVQLIIEERQGILRLEVQDSGIGIPQDQLPYIFDRFYQVTGPQQAKRSGTGIGLSLTKELTELLGGTIRVDSQLEEGTTFLLVIPITRNAPLKASPHLPQQADLIVQPVGDSTPNHQTAAVLATKEEVSVLIVEDNVDMADYIASCLGPQYHVDFALNGQLGLDQALSNVPDLIISDVMMPEMDGFEMCQAVKADERTSHIPVILLTARAGIDKKLEGLRRGADAYLSKPFNEEELQIRVEQLLNLREQLRKRWQQTMSDNTQPIAADDPLEHQFMNRIQEVINNNLQQASFEVEDLAREMGMSESQVRRKLTALTGLPPVRFIRSVKIQRAQDLLRSTALSVSEVAYEIGFSDPKYFSRIFSRATGSSPSDYRKRQDVDV